MSQIATRVHAALNRWWAGDGSPSEALLGGLLAIAYAFSFVLLLVWLNTPINELGEWRVFVEAWLLVPLFALAAVLVVQSRDARDQQVQLGGLAFCQALVVTASAVGLRAAAQAEPAFESSTLALMMCGPSLVAALGLVCPASWLSLPGRRGPAASLILLLLAAAALGLPELPAASQIVLIAAGAGGLSLVREACSRVRSSRGRDERTSYRAGVWLLDLATIGVGAWGLFDRHLHFDVVHSNWFLGPAHEILQGATMLADVACAYGILSIYFLAGALALWPFPMSYFALSATVMGLAIAQYTTCYLLLRSLGVAWVHAATGLAVVFIANFIGLQGAMSAYPSLGPLRFALPYLLLIAVALRRHRQSWTLATRIGESLIVAISSLWSLEAFVFALPAYLAIVVLEAGFAARFGSRTSPGWLATAVIRVGATAVAIAAIHTAFAFFVHARVGGWPDWPSYFALVAAYTPAGASFLLEPIPALGHWVGLGFVYAASALGCLLAAPRARGYRDQGALVLVLAATVMGVGQFSIYIGMSSVYRLACIVMPAVFVAAYWVDRLARSSSMGRAPGRVVAFAAYATAALTLLHFGGTVEQWWAHDSTGSLGDGFLAKRKKGCETFPNCLRDPPIAAPLTRPTQRLLNRHARSGENIALILDEKATVEVLMRTGRRNAVSTSGTVQDSLAARNRDRVAAAPHRLEVGDLVLSEVALEGGEPLVINGIDVRSLQLGLLRRICAEFVCKKVDRRGGIVVTRLTDRN